MNKSLGLVRTRLASHLFRPCLSLLPGGMATVQPAHVVPSRYLGGSSLPINVSYNAGREGTRVLACPGPMLLRGVPWETSFLLWPSFPHHKNQGWKEMMTANIHTGGAESWPQKAAPKPVLWAGRAESFLSVRDDIPQHLERCAYTPWSTCSLQDNEHELQCEWTGFVDGSVKTLESIWIGSGLGVPPGVWQRQGKCVENNQAKTLIPMGEQPRFTCSTCSILPPVPVCGVNFSGSEEHALINYRMFLFA